MRLAIAFVVGLFATILPGIGADGRACNPTLKAHVYKPARLTVLQSCVAVTGTIVDATHGKRKDGVRHEADGDTHGQLRLNPGFEFALNDGNRKFQGGNLVYEIVCAFPVTQADAKSACRGYRSPIKLLPIGTCVEIVGALVRDGNHGKWLELHPVSSLRALPADACAAPDSRDERRDLVPAQPLPNAPDDGMDVNVEQPRGLGGRHLLAGDGQPHVVPDVATLRIEARPPAVAGLVVPVDVLSVERVPARAVPHVGEKPLEIATPLLAHQDPSSAVVGKMLAIRVVAPVFRSLPRTVFACAVAAVPPVARADRFALDAATRSRRPFSERLLLAERGSPAVAATTPDAVDASGRRARAVREFHDDESTKALTCEINSHAIF